jgi:hypothetical protein
MWGPTLSFNNSLNENEALGVLYCGIQLTTQCSVSWYRRKKVVLMHSDVVNMATALENAYE